MANEALELVIAEIQKMGEIEAVKHPFANYLNTLKIRFEDDTIELTTEQKASLKTKYESLRDSYLLKIIELYGNRIDELQEG